MMELAFGLSQTLLQHHRRNVSILEWTHKQLVAAPHDVGMSDSTMIERSVINVGLCCLSCSPEQHHIHSLSCMLSPITTI